MCLQSRQPQRWADRNADRYGRYCLTAGWIVATVATTLYERNDWPFWPTAGASVVVYLLLGYALSRFSPDREPRPVGRCGASFPGFFPGTMPDICALLAGHAGWHRGDEGAEWSRDPGAPASSPGA